MSNVSLKALYNATQRFAIGKNGIKKDASIEELCDFGDSYGFLFSSDNPYSNCYWCVDKKTYKPFAFRPNQDINKFMNRKIIDTDKVK